MNAPSLSAMELSPVIPIAALARTPRADLPALISRMLDRADQAGIFMSQFHLFSATGDLDFAVEMQKRALEISRVYRLAGNPDPAIRMLVLMGAGCQSVNTPIDYLVENSDIRVDLLYVIPGLPLPECIPEHDVAMVVLGESDASRPVLQAMETLTSRWQRPVLNLPGKILRCSRDGVYRMLDGIAGLAMPATLRMERGELERAVRNGHDAIESGYPITIRPLVSQGGMGLAKIADAAQLAAYLDGSAEQAFFVSCYVDYRSPDGYYRKARIALIDGRPYACHLAIGENWIVHYGSAGMEASEAKREEEARFMREFDEGFALRHADALRLIADRLGLDYVVIDCAETRDGKLLLFEADNRSWVHATDPVELFPYKQEAMRRVFAAFRAMLLSAVFVWRRGGGKPGCLFLI